MAGQAFRDEAQETPPASAQTAHTVSLKAKRLRRKNGALGVVLAGVVVTVFVVAVALGIAIHYMQIHHVLGPL